VVRGALAAGRVVKNDPMMQHPLTVMGPDGKAAVAETRREGEGFSVQEVRVVAEK
jgi:hypothetical protein